MVERSSLWSSLFPSAHHNMHFSNIFLTGLLIISWCSISVATISSVFDHRSAFESQNLKSCLSPDLLQHEKATCRFFAITIDAGSTGTRLHLFEFSHDLDSESAPFIVEKETFKEVKPGLSSFAADPLEAGRSVSTLLDLANEVVPANLYKHTPISLKATAGLRLLPDEQTEAIMEAVSRTVSSSVFLVNEDSVSVMSGTDEGVFGWFTLNLLLGKMGSVQTLKSCREHLAPSNASAAALDLGGGSTQVTLRPLEDQTFENAPDHFEHDVSIFGTTVRLYSHSYLGNGLVAARLGMLQLHERSTGVKLVSTCFPQDYSLNEWNYALERWHIRGDSGYGFESCYSTARAYISKTAILPVPELSRRDIYAFSYFFDRGLQARLVADTKGGHTTVGHFKGAAEIACARPLSALAGEHWLPWQCLDLTYIYTVLRDGYGLADDKQITLAKKLRDMEVSWALGASYHLLNTYHEQAHGANNNNNNNNNQGNAGNAENAGNAGNSAMDRNQSMLSSGYHYYCTSFINNVYAFVCSRATTVLSYMNLLA